MTFVLAMPYTSFCRQKPSMAIVKWETRVFLRLFLSSFSLLLNMHHGKKGSPWLIKSVSQEWPGRDTQLAGDRPQECCRALQLEGFPGWQGSQKEGGGGMTGTTATRCKLGDNALLINFLFLCHNDRQHYSHDKIESWIKGKIERRLGWREQLRAAPLL